MADIIYTESAYRFTNPIRFFKANDPYYWEVDNIPLKQLQENNLWLKDQLAGGSIRVENIQRSSLDELRPVVTETNRQVTVHKGRYTARVNDAYHIQPLAAIKQQIVLDDNVIPMNSHFDSLVAQEGGGATYNDYPFTADELFNILSRLKNSLAADALHLNGLAERAFSRPMKDSQTAGGWNDSDFDYPYGAPVNDTIATQDPIMPVLQAKLWQVLGSNVSNAQAGLDVYNWGQEHYGYLYLNLLENLFIKRWRGIARTALVDVPENLQIDIPQFSTDEFFYYDRQGNKQLISGVENRIDLLFIYSKPVDTSGVCITKGGEKTTITEPALGLVKGAGLGMNFQDGGGSFLSENAFDADGNLLTLPSVGDQKDTNTGFKNITQFNGTDATQKFSAHGSFPAPDDIVNLAPLLAESLEGTEWDLVGQSILPIAYIISTSDSDVIRTRDVVDIRPFFRTAELAYNERSGIAAATPPLSLANPAVGEREVERREKRVLTKQKLAIDNLQFQMNALQDLLPIKQPMLEARLLRKGNEPGPTTGQWQNTTTSSMSWTQDTRGLGYKGCFIRGARVHNPFNYGNLSPLVGLPAITSHNHTGFFDTTRQDSFAYENWLGLDNPASSDRAPLTTDTLVLLGPGLWEIDVTLNVMSSKVGIPRQGESNRGDYVKLVLWDYGRNKWIERAIQSQYADEVGGGSDRPVFREKIFLPVTMSDLTDTDNIVDRYTQIGIGVECTHQDGSDAWFSMDGNLSIKRVSNTDGTMGKVTSGANQALAGGHPNATNSVERGIRTKGVNSASLI